MAQVAFDVVRQATGEIPKKNPYDKTSTRRSKRLGEDIKAAGGAAFTVRSPTAVELAQLDDLVTWGEGDNRNDVLRKLVAGRHKKLLKKRETT